MTLDVIETVCQLVRIPSLNPMGREVDDSDQWYEHAVTDYLQQLFTRLEVAWQRQPVEPKRENILARIDGQVPLEEGGKLLVLEAHQDTVPVEGMTIAPWDPQVSGGRVTGRGSCDIKGGMAAMLTAFSRLAAERPKGMPTVVMACSVNEEHGYRGALQMARSWSDGSSRILPRRPDAVIVAEPTLLDVVVAHKGVARWRCHTRGRASHSSVPQNGENAVYHMARVLNVLEQYARDVVSQLGEHPLVGRPTLSVGTIHGGISVNTVPDRCTIEIDRRVLPGEDAFRARQHVLDYLAEHLPTVPMEHDEPYIASTGLSDEHNGPLAEQLGNFAARHGGGRRIGVPYGTDAPAFCAEGAPCVVFGPGSIEQAHTKDEWVAIEQLEKAAEIYYEFASRFGA